MDQRPFRFDAERSWIGLWIGSSRENLGIVVRTDLFLGAFCVSFRGNQARSLVARPRNGVGGVWLHLRNGAFELLPLGGPVVSLYCDSVARPSARETCGNSSCGACRDGPSVRHHLARLRVCLHQHRGSSAAAIPVRSGAGGSGCDLFRSLLFLAPHYFRGGAGPVLLVQRGGPIDPLREEDT